LQISSAVQSVSQDGISTATLELAIFNRNNVYPYRSQALRGNDVKTMWRWFYLRLFLLVWPLTGLPLRRWDLTEILSLASSKGLLDEVLLSEAEPSIIIKNKIMQIPITVTIVKLPFLLRCYFQYCQYR